MCNGKVMKFWSTAMALGTTIFKEKHKLVMSQFKGLGNWLEVSQGREKCKRLLWENKGTFWRELLRRGFEEFSFINIMVSLGHAGADEWVKIWLVKVVAIRVSQENGGVGGRMLGKKGKKVGTAGKGARKNKRKSH